MTTIKQLLAKQDAELGKADFYVYGPLGMGIDSKKLKSWHHQATIVVITELVKAIGEEIQNVNPYKHQPFWKQEPKTEEEIISKEAYYNGANTTKVMIGQKLAKIMEEMENE